MLKKLQATLDYNRLELIRISDYNGGTWDDYRRSCRDVISDVESAIANVTANGLPDGYSENPHWKKGRVNV